MRLGYVIAYVPDLAVAIDFYERAFGLTRRFVAEDYGELDTGGTTLAFATEALGKQNGVAVRPTRPVEDAPAIELAFVTDDVAGAVQRAVAAGATLVKEPTAKPWGQTVAYVRDPNGLLVELCTPVSS